MTTVLTGTQLMTVWIDAGGAPGWAALMAGIALAESGGQVTIVQQGEPYAATGWGLWQITPGNSEPQVGTNTALLTPTTNAQAALAKFNAQGLTAWLGDRTWNAWQDAGSPAMPTVAQVAQYVKSWGGTFGLTTLSTTGQVSYDTTQSAFLKAYGTAGEPPKGFGSTASTNDIVINGATLAERVGDCVVTVQMTLSLTKSSSITVSINDPTRVVIKSGVFSSQATLTLGGHTYVLQGVEKETTVLDLTFIPWVVYALEQETGAFTVAPGHLTRTDFARLLVAQIDGAEFWQATESYLASLGSTTGYAHTTKEQLSRGTIDAPLENSWTCLQRLASEIQWVCFEVFGRVYFGPYSYLAAQIPAMTPHEFEGGITTITGDYTTGQPTGEITIDCVADSWVPTPGTCIQITTLGPFDGNWIVMEMTREDIEEPTITVTLMQPQPSLPEPKSGGTNPAVGAGAGNVQTTGGRQAAESAVKFALAQVGKGYSETPALRLGPTYFDCSGLVYEAYESTGVAIGTTTYTQWPDGAGTRVPAGVSNLLPADLLFFGPAVGGTATHVAMVVSVTSTHGTVKVVEAADPAQGVITTTDVDPTIGAYYGTLVYLGATRPAP